MESLFQNLHVEYELLAFLLAPGKHFLSMGLVYIKYTSYDDHVTIVTHHQSLGSKQTVCQFKHQQQKHACRTAVPPWQTLIEPISAHPGMLAEK